MRVPEFDSLRTYLDNWEGGCGAGALSDERIDEILSQHPMFGASYIQARECGSLGRFLKDFEPAMVEWLARIMDHGLPCNTSFNRDVLKVMYKEVTGADLPYEGHVHERLSGELLSAYMGPAGEFMRKMPDIIISIAGSASSYSGDALCREVADWTRNLSGTPINVTVADMQTALSNCPVLAELAGTEKGRTILAKLGLEKSIAEGILNNRYALTGGDLIALLKQAYFYSHGTECSVDIKAALLADSSPVKNKDLVHYTADTLIASVEYVSSFA